MTLTSMYNVLESLRRGAALTANERIVHEHGLVGVLRTLHDDLDAAVLAAYGWSDLNLPVNTDTLLERLVALNARRAGEEAAGTLFGGCARRFRRQRQPANRRRSTWIPTTTPRRRHPLRRSRPLFRSDRGRPGLPDQIKAVADVLAEAGQPMTLDLTAAHFTARGRWRDRLPTILETLEALGRAKRLDGNRWRDAGRA